MQSKATTVRQYLAGLPADRRATLEAVRSVILENLGSGYEEGMQYGMISYYVPHRIYPAGYHCDPRQPLPFVALASQKNYCSLYLMCVYSDPVLRRDFEQLWSDSGKKLNMGKSCVRFKKVGDLALDAIASMLRAVPIKRCVAYYESVVKTRSNHSTTKKPKARVVKQPRSTTSSANTKRVRS